MVYHHLLGILNRAQVEALYVKIFPGSVIDKSAKIANLRANIIAACKGNVLADTILRKDVANIVLGYAETPQGNETDPKDESFIFNQFSNVASPLPGQRPELDLENLLPGFNVADLVANFERFSTEWQQGDHSPMPSTSTNFSTGFQNPQLNLPQPNSFNPNQSQLNPPNPSTSFSKDDIFAMISFFADKFKPHNSYGKSRTLNFIKECNRRKISFSGAVGEKVVLFIEKIEDVIKIIQPSDSDIVLSFSQVLTNSALQSYRMFEGKIKTWTELKQHLLKTYAATNEESQAFAKMVQRTQRDLESVDAYVDHVQFEPVLTVTA